MDSFDTLLRKVMEKPSVAGLQMICAQVEAWDAYMPTRVKEKAQRAVAAFHADQNLSSHEDMLRLYRVLAKHSRKLGAAKVLEKVEERGRFRRSLKFHLMWAEAYAQAGDWDLFSHVMNLARHRLYESPNDEREEGFRDLVDQYFPGSDLSGSGADKPVDLLLPTSSYSTSTPSPVHVIPNMSTMAPTASRTKLRPELVDRPKEDYLAPSIEELRAATIAHQQMAVEDNYISIPMDISRNESITQTLLGDDEEQRNNKCKLGTAVDASIASNQGRCLRFTPSPFSEAASGDSGTARETKVNDPADVPEHGELPNRTRIMFEEEQTISGAKFSYLGVDKKPVYGIMTSTPAHAARRRPTDEDFFAPLNRELQQHLEDGADEHSGEYVDNSIMDRPMHEANHSQDSSVGVSNHTRSSSQHSDSGTLNLECEIDSSFSQEKTADGTLRQEETKAGSLCDENSQIAPSKLAAALSLYQKVDSPCPLFSVGEDVTFDGETFEVVSLIKKRGFADVYRVLNKEGGALALKCEMPPCPWEVYICNELKARVNNSFVLDSIMQITHAYFFSDASIILSKFHPYGSLLGQAIIVSPLPDITLLQDLASKITNPSWYIVLLAALQMGKILQDVQAAQIVHRDVKPENFLILEKLDGSCSDVSRIMNTPIVKLIDWGSAIDMTNPSESNSASGKRSVLHECSSAESDRPWTYQADYFGFVETLHVLIFNKYPEVAKKDGVHTLRSTMKRRFPIRALLENIFHAFLNIPSCDELPSWSSTLKDMEDTFVSRFAASEWRKAAAEFNSFL